MPSLVVNGLQMNEILNCAPAYLVPKYPNLNWAKARVTYCDLSDDSFVFTPGDCSDLKSDGIRAHKFK